MVKVASRAKASRIAAERWELSDCSHKTIKGVECISIGETFVEMSLSGKSEDGLEVPTRLFCDGYKGIVRCIVVVSLHIEQVIVLPVSEADPASAPVEVRVSSVLVEQLNSSGALVVVINAVPEFTVSLQSFNTLIHRLRRLIELEVCLLVG